MQTKLVWELIRKDWAEIFRSKQVYMFIIVLPGVLVLGMPLLLTFVMNFFPQLMALNPVTAGLIAFLPPVIPEPQWSQLAEGTKLMLTIATVSQLFILIVPVMIGSSLSIDTIVGEKERKTIEGLLSLPLTTSEILTAKVLSSVLPGLISTGFFVVGHIVFIDILLFPYLGWFFLPNLQFLLFVVVLSPLVAIASVLFTVAISARVGTIMNAQQLTSFLVLPLLLIIISQLFLLMLNLLTILFGVIILLIINFGLFWLSIRIFNREKLVISG